MGGRSRREVSEEVVAASICAPSDKAVQIMDIGVGVSALAWWRRTAVDGVADGGGRRRVGWRGCFFSYRADALFIFICMLGWLQ